MAATAVPTTPGRPRSRTFETLIDNPAYRRFYIGHGVSLIGTWLQGAAVSWIVFDMTGSEWWLGVVEAANLLPGLFVGLLAGALADRVVPKRMVLMTQLAQMFLALILAVLVSLGVVRIWQMLVILALARVAIAFEMPARQVFLYELVGRPQLSNAIALNVGLFNASRVVGPALAGVTLAWLGNSAPFYLNGLSYLAAILAILSIRSRNLPNTSGGKGFGDLWGGLAHVRDNRRMAILFGLMTFFGIAGMGYSAMLSAYAREYVGTGALGYSVLLASGGVGATAGALAVAALGNHWRKESLILGGMLIFAVALAAAGTLPGSFATSGPFWWPMASAMLSLLAAGLGSILFYSSMQTLIQLTTPDHLRGRIMGVWMIIFSGSVPLGALWIGWLSQSIGVENALKISAVCCALVALFVRSTNQLARPEHSSRT